MGRHKVYKTPEEIAAQQAIYAERHNAKRRAKYREDADYRAIQRRLARETRRRLSGKTEQQCREKADQCSAAMRDLRRIGARRQVYVSGEVIGSDVTLTIPEMAKALGLRSAIAVREWIADGRFPSPSNEVCVTRRHAMAYTAGEAKKLLRVMRDHYMVKEYYLATDTGTRDRLFAALEGGE